MLFSLFLFRQNPIYNCMMLLLPRCSNVFLAPVSNLLKKLHPNQCKRKCQHLRQQIQATRFLLCQNATVQCLFFLPLPRDVLIFLPCCHRNLCRIQIFRLPLSLSYTISQQIFLRFLLLHIPLFSHNHHLSMYAGNAGFNYANFIIVRVETVGFAPPAF